MEVIVNRISKDLNSFLQKFVKDTKYKKTSKNKWFYRSSIYSIQKFTMKFQNFGIILDFYWFV